MFGWFHLRGDGGGEDEGVGGVGFSISLELAFRVCETHVVQLLRMQRGSSVPAHLKRKRERRGGEEREHMRGDDQLYIEHVKILSFLLIPFFPLLPFFMLNRVVLPASCWSLRACGLLATDTSCTSCLVVRQALPDRFRFYCWAIE